MRILAVRHTTPDVAPGECYGQRDVPVATSWESEFNQVCRALTPQLQTPAPLIVTSPLSRCRKLADYLAISLGADRPSRDRRPRSRVVVDPDAAELSFGSWEGLRWDEIPEAELKPWMDDWKHCAAGASGSDGESLPELLLRVQGMMSRYAAEDEMILVTHAGVIRSLAHLLGGISLEDAWQLSLEYGGIREFVDRK